MKENIKLKLNDLVATIGKFMVEENKIELASVKTLDGKTELFYDGELKEGVILQIAGEGEEKVNAPAGIYEVEGKKLTVGEEGIVSKVEEVKVEEEVKPVEEEVKPVEVKVEAEDVTTLLETTLADGTKVYSKSSWITAGDAVFSDMEGTQPIADGSLILPDKTYITKTTLTVAGGLVTNVDNVNSESVSLSEEFSKNLSEKDNIIKELNEKIEKFTKENEQIVLLNEQIKVLNEELGKPVGKPIKDKIKEKYQSNDLSSISETAKRYSEILNAK